MWPVLCQHKALTNSWRRGRKLGVWELCESQGSCPGLSILMSLMVCVGVKQHWTVLWHWSQFVPNMSTDIRGCEALHHRHQTDGHPSQIHTTEGWEWSVDIPVMQLSAVVCSLSVDFCHYKKWRMKQKRASLVCLAAFYSSMWCVCQPCHCGKQGMKCKVDCESHSIL